MVNEKLPNYVVPDLADFKVLIFVNFKDYLYIFECCESSKGRVLCSFTLYRMLIDMEAF